jgi:hypothetical protein
LEGFAHLEAHGHEGHAGGAIRLRLPPALGEFADRASAARVAHGQQRPEHRLDATALALVAMVVGLQPGGQSFLVGSENAGQGCPLGIAGLDHLVRLKPLCGCVARDAQPAAGFAHAQVVTVDHAAQFAQCAHVYHSCTPLLQKTAGYVDTWLKIGRDGRPLVAQFCS